MATDIPDDRTLAVCGTRANAGDGAPTGNDGPKFYREKIEPVLVSECYRCHSAGAKQLRGNLKLDSRAAMLQGGDTGPAVVPGKAGESLIVQALRHQDGLEMPPKSRGSPHRSSRTSRPGSRWRPRAAGR